MLADIIEAGINNPDCSFFVGATIGPVVTYTNLIVIILAILAYRFVSIAWIEPLAKRVQERFLRIKE